MTVYVDTCVLGAYYCPENLSAAAEDTITALDALTISPLTEVEFVSLVTRKRRVRDFTLRKANKILETFRAHVADGYYKKIKIESEHFHAARDLIAKNKQNLRTLDALHLALAHANALTLLTADRSLAAAAKAGGCRREANRGVDGIACR